MNNKNTYNVIKDTIAQVHNKIDKDKENYIKKIAKSDFLCDIPKNYLNFENISISFFGNLDDIYNIFKNSKEEDVVKNTIISKNDKEIIYTYNIYSTTHKMEHSLRISIAKT